MPRTLAILLALSTACSRPMHVIAAASQPESRPASQPASFPAYPAQLLRPLDPSRPTGDQIISRDGLQALSARVIAQRAQSAEFLADCTARERTANDQRDAATAQSQQDAWNATWLPVIGAVGGAAAAAVVETVIVWVLGAVKR